MSAQADPRALDRRARPWPGRLLVRTPPRVGADTLWLVPLLPLWLAIGLIRGNDLAAIGDETPFLRYAHNLLHGGYATPHTMDATQFLWHAPGLPTLLTPLVALDVPLQAMRLIGPLLLFAAFLLFHRLLRLRLSRGRALAGTWLLGCYLPFGEIVGPLHREPLALVLLVAAMLGTTRYLDHGRPRHLLLAGGALAGLAMTREEFGWVLVLLLGVALAWCLASGIRARISGGRTVRAGSGRRDDDPRSAVPPRALRIAAVAVLGCVPWLVYTHALTGRLLYWGSAGGLSLWWMAPHPHQLGQWHSVTSVFTTPALAPFRPFFGHLATLPPLQRDHTLQHAALHAILADPAGYARNLLANVARGFTAWPISEKIPPIAVALETGFSAALLLALAWSLRGWRRLPPEAGPFAAFGMAGFVVHLPASSEPRLLLPLVPIALWTVVSAGRSRTRRSPRGRGRAGRASRGRGRRAS